MRISAVVSLALSIAAVPHVPSIVAAQTPSAGALKIVVIAGEDAVNIVQQKSAVAPIVEVRDKNDQPVAGVIVRFAIRRGQATFNGARELTLTTNAAGRAAVTSFTPVGKGALQIGVTAQLQGQTAVATITQTNVMTAAQATNAVSAGAGSGGGFPTTLAAVGGGAAAGGIVVAKSVRSNKEPSLGCQGGIGINQGLVEVTTFMVGMTCDEDGRPLTASFDFGDGTTATGNDVTHVYRSTGTFVVMVTLTGGKNTYPPMQHGLITVATVTGRWRHTSTGSLFDIVQSGNRVSGSYTVPPPGTGSSVFSGTLQHPQSINLTLNLAGPPVGTLLANFGTDLNTMNTTASGAGFPTAQTTLVRQ